MKKAFLLISTIVSLTNIAFAQKENNVWAFGDQMGIDFNTTPPSVIQTAMVTYGGSASVCDTGGQLLFYTQGDTIWNKNNQIMPNGSGLIAPYISNSAIHWTPQGQLIVPVINNPSQYYVFSMENMDDAYNGDTAASRLFYSIVDMTLDGGLGDVVPAEREIELDSVLTSTKMIAVPGDSCSIWLLVHGIANSTFKAYKINDAGINPNPVISVCGNTFPGAYINGKMKASPDGRRLVTTNVYNIYYNNVLGYGCELFDFNTATGIVSNPIVLDSLVQGISACFSPDDSKLYYFTFGGGNGNLYQFDLSQPTTAAIINSQTLIDSLVNTGTGENDAKIGPDGKVYTSMPYAIYPPYTSTYDSIGRIDFPNVAGTACSFTRAALISQQVSYSNGDLPNDVVRPLQDTSFASAETNLMLTGNLTLHAPAGYTTYHWNTGATADSITITATGTFWVVSKDYCGVMTDTFHVHPPLGINNITPQAGGLTLYPNPADNDITVAIGTVNGAGHVSVTDVLGKTVITTPVQGSTVHINVANLAAGVYQVIYTNDNTPGTRLHASLVVSK